MARGNTSGVDALLNGAVLEVTTHSAEETRELGRRAGAAMSGGEVVLLIGELGAGKTTLTQGIARGLDIEEYAKSPTFVLVHEYEGRVRLYHIDLYRIAGDLEAWDIGIDEYLDSDGVSVIEWADRALKVFPVDRLVVRLESPSENERRFLFEASGPRSAAVLAALKKG